jgi:hypothetical protein
MFGRFRRSGDPVGFALSGGGACQVGGLNALTEAGNWPSIVAGTSGGAVNATWFALYPHRLDKPEAIWLALRTRDVFPGSRVRGLLNLTRHGYIHGAEAGEAFLYRNSEGARFEEVDRVSGLQTTRGRRVHILRPELPELDDGRDFGRTAEMVVAEYVWTQRYLQGQSPSRPDGRNHPLSSSTG